MNSLKTYFFLAISSLLIASCGSYTQKKSTNIKEEPVVIANDSLEYQIIIIDQGFTNYLKSIARPMNFYSQNFLESKNKFYVIEWNNRARNPTRYNANIYENIIDYESNINYGLEVNYKLYWYFKFAEQKYRMKLN
ncbi:hypothetical protein GCM10011416_12700 [Polaribacter pacificus]|uniref:Lipoprotein n=1 Tax=Polaribacter pacificus TaxID=1775173 RepID=A0A917HZK1_9FLAO|nr:DUF6146 family protein [Polaribacter pacificus]GGG96407.1 hypothetical protein GCM10011416_12700 [Polaribacter pacificus]